MATGRWQPSAVNPAVWDSFTWADPNLIEGSVAGVSTSAGSSTGVVAFAGSAAGASTSAATTQGFIGLLGSAQGTSTSAGTATGVEQDQGIVAGSSVTAGFANGSPDLLGTSSGNTISTGTAIGSKPAPAPVARPGRAIQPPKPAPLARKGEVFGYTLSNGSVAGAQGFAGEARRGFTQTFGVANRSSYIYTGTTRGEEILIEHRLNGIVKIHRIVRQREEDALLAALR